MGDTNTIPLFPLGVVLLPYAELPLHIFEERYKQLINECLSGNKVFGIVYQDDQQLHKTGCTARVERVLKRYNDGRLDIIVTGENRFRIIDISDDKPYLQSDINYLEDDVSGDSREMTRLARNGIELLRKLEKIMEINEGLERVKTLDFSAISYLLAGSHGLTLAEKQELLEIGNTGDRLDKSVDLLKDAVNRAKLLRQISVVSKDTIMTHGFSRN